MVQVVKKPLSKLKSLLPPSVVPSALPSQVKKPGETKQPRGANPSKLQNVPKAAPPTGAAVPRKTSAPTITSNTRSSGLMQPGKKIPRRSLDIVGPLKPARGTFVKPVNPPIKEVRVSRPSSAANPTARPAATTPTRGRGAAKSKSNPSTPTGRRGSVKQPISTTTAAGSHPPSTTTTAGPHPPSSTTTAAPHPSSSTASVAETAGNVATSSNNKSTGLSTSIVSSGSPSVQQSTPMRLVSHSKAAATKEGEKLQTL